MVLCAFCMYVGEYWSERTQHSLRGVQTENYTQTKCSVRMNVVNAILKFYIILSINNHCCSCVGGSPLRSARDVLKKLGVSSRRKSTSTSLNNAGTATYLKLPKTNGNDDIDDNEGEPSALKPPPPSCFGYGSKQEGTWSATGTWIPKQKGQCDLNEYWDFFEDKDTATAVVRCWERRRWVVFVGDSNSREMFSAIVNRLKKLKYKYAFLSGNNKNKFGDNRWSDEDAIFYDDGTGKHNILFRLSFRFYQGYDEFKSHWKNWDIVYEADGRSNIMESKDPSFLLKLNTFHNIFQSKSPDTIIFSTGLWKLDCKKSSMAYNQLLKELNENDVSNVLFFTPGHLKFHPTINNKDVKKIRDCIFATRDKLLYNVRSTKSVLPILDVFELTKNVPDLSWIGNGGGYHYVSDSGVPSPAGKAIIAAWNSFACN